MSVNKNELPIELLQPEISGQIKQINLEELKIWINEGKLQPNHLLRIKNLSWIEAQKIPAFQPLFELKKNEKPEQSNHFTNQLITKTVASEQTKSESIDSALTSVANSKEATNISKETTFSNDDNSAESKHKTAEPSVVFKAFEKKALAGKNKPTGRNAKNIQTPPKSPKKSLMLKQAIGFIAGCMLAFLLSLGSSYLWVYQLKTPAEIDEKSLSELANLENRLTADKLDLRLEEATQEQKLKDEGNRENSPQPTDFSQKIIQLEKRYADQRKTAVENHRERLKDSDFATTFYFSFAFLLALFLLARIFYGKNPQTVENQYFSKTRARRLRAPLDFPVTNLQNTEAENSKNESSPAEETRPAEIHLTESVSESENVRKIVYVSEDSGAEESVKSNNCLLHQQISARFICINCENYFCDKCLNTLGEIENCCPFCKLECKLLEAKTSDSATTKLSPEEKKKVGLLDLGKDSNFIVYDYSDEKTRKLGIIPAFIISLLFAAAISILWVHKISPFLENRNKEISQNISPNQPKNSDQTITNADKTVDEKTANEKTANDESCIDPETRKPFECDEETRKVLYEHTRKIKSVEKARKEAAEKTSLFSSSNNSSSENNTQETPKTGASRFGMTELEKQQMIKTFGISFVIIFGLLMFGRLFRKS